MISIVSAFLTAVIKLIILGAFAACGIALGVVLAKKRNQKKANEAAAQKE